MTLQGIRLVSEQRIQFLGLPTNSQNLPFTGSSVVFPIVRTQDEIMNRIILLLGVMSVAYGSDQHFIANKFKELEIWHFLSPKEKEFLENENTDWEQEMTWCVENIVILLWAVQIIEEIPPFDEEYNLRQIAEKLPAKLDILSIQAFYKACSLRNSLEIWQEADFTYYLHWALVECRIYQLSMPVRILEGIIYERDYTFTWLISPHIEWGEIEIHT